MFLSQLCEELVAAQRLDEFVEISTVALVHPAFMNDPALIKVPHAHTHTHTHAHKAITYTHTRARTHTTSVLSALVGGLGCVRVVIRVYFCEGVVCVAKCVQLGLCGWVWAWTHNSCAQHIQIYRKIPRIRPLRVKDHPPFFNHKISSKPFFTFSRKLFIHANSKFF